MRKFIIILSIGIPLASFGQSTILRNVNVVDVINNRIVSGRSVEVKNDIIFRLHDSSYTGSPEDSVIDLTGKYIIPGLIDSHTHIEHSAYGHYNPPRNNLVELLEHALRGGLTTIREMACDARVIGELSRAAKLNLINSPNIYYPSLFAGPRFFRDPRTAAMALGETKGQVSWSHIIDENSNLPQYVAQAKGNGSSALKLYALLNADQIDAIVKEAHGQGLKVWAHASTQLAKPSEIVDSGVDGLSHALMLLSELDGKPDYSKYPGNDEQLRAVFRKMKEKNVSFDPTIFIYNDAIRKRPRSGVAKEITKRAYEAGVLIVAGTDSISAYRDEKLPFIHKEIESYTTDCGFSTIDALKTATINGAITLGIDNETGSVEEKKKANLVILNKNPLEDIRNTREIHFVMKDGIIFKRE